MTGHHLLPGQAAAPEGPADLSMMYVLHHGFRRDLARFVDAAHRTPPSERATWQALLDRWDLFALLLHDHHHKEDEHLWPMLRGRVVAAGNRTAADVLDEMEAEHATIGPLLEAVRTGFARMAAHSDDPVSTRLVVELGRARRVLNDHLGHEERDAIAILQRYVPGSEWAAIERTKFRRGLSPGDLLNLLPWCVQGLPASVVRPLLSEAGLPFRVMLRLGRRRFDRLDRAAFAYVSGEVGA